MTDQDSALPARWRTVTAGNGICSGVSSTSSSGIVVHTLPIDDTREHEMSRTCWCQPWLTPHSAVHNAEDGRAFTSPVKSTPTRTPPVLLRADVIARLRAAADGLAHVASKSSKPVAEKAIAQVMGIEEAIRLLSEPDLSTALAEATSVLAQVECVLNGEAVDDFAASFPVVRGVLDLRQQLAEARQEIATLTSERDAYKRVATNIANTPIVKGDYDNVVKAVVFECERADAAEARLAQVEAERDAAKELGRLEVRQELMAAVRRFSDDEAADRDREGR